MAESFDIVFYLALSMLLAHELDAVHRHEWRLLFFLRTLSDSLGRNLFIWLHIPIVALIFFLITHNQYMLRYWTMMCLNLFMVIHAGLHWRLEKHPKYEFKSLGSKLLIYGAAVVSIIHMLVLLIIAQVR